ncbi:hypothetical protein ACO0LG_10030 [Undibacterium sp. Ji42W]|uniref:hypothetical protein n=1 Tax=Undibacterium sp. Ji42W TaxID=3413039 RepID=UPI003BF2F004
MANKQQGIVTLELTTEQASLLKVVMRSALIANADEYFFAEQAKDATTLAALTQRGGRLAAINTRLNAHA